MLELKDASAVGNLLRWGQLNNTLLHEDVEIYKDSKTGLSFKARNEIPPGTTMVSSSYSTTLSYLNTTQLSSDFELHGSQPFPSEFTQALSQEDPNVIGYFFLMQQYLMGSDSFWSEYIRLLPQPDQPESLAIPIWWPEADQKFLAGTNAEPPIAKRQHLWKSEYNRAIRILKSNFEGWEQYTYILYQWAATMFGTRSFRASLTIPAELFRGDARQTLDHIERDRFSILFPILDIGNHDGINRVNWSKSPASRQLNLVSKEMFQHGSQIYNYYGHKFNSELLVGYGFTLPGLQYDAVNLKLSPPVSALELCRSLNCHQRSNPGQQEEFMFKVQLNSEKGNVGVTETRFFSHGLLDTIACMVANHREHRFISKNPSYCIENDPAIYSGPMARNLLLVLHILRDKLHSEINRLQDTGKALKIPDYDNHNQQMALDYRARQLSVLENTLKSIQARLSAVTSFSSLCSHNHGSNQESDHSFVDMHSRVELISLSCAFDWLEHQYPDVHNAVSKIISKDQDEELPLNWDILIEDWDSVYWIVWIYLVWMLWALDNEGFQKKHPSIGSWLNRVSLSHSDNMTVKDLTGTFFAEPSEHETINHTLHEINQLSQFDAVKEWLQLEQVSWQGLRNYASFVETEETIPAEIVERDFGPHEAPKKMLVIVKGNGLVHSAPVNPWSQFLQRSPGHANSTK
ncbi:hypothetical protein BGZ60DRAFT_34760 [Tricladium varicosporioides]|nr:hypothetical protein BGZ60DRAFT_34760 [Hymenoscyphus varicosporioides]